jgi:hypothetical protein
MKPAISILGRKESGNTCFRFSVVSRQRDAHFPVAVLVFERTEAETDMGFEHPEFWKERAKRDIMYMISRFWRARRRSHRVPCLQFLKKRKKRGTSPCWISFKGFAETPYILFWLLVMMFSLLVIMLRAGEEKA